MDIHIHKHALISMLIDDINKANPDAVKFVVTDKDKDNIYEWIENKKYDKIMYMYGHPFLLELLKLCENLESYESCQNIVESIRKHNKTVNDNLATK